MGVDLDDPVVETGIRSNYLQFLTRSGAKCRNLLSRIPRLGSWSWPLTIAAALIYMACFSSFISRHTSLPFWDGFGYVQKTRNLADKFYQASFTQRLNPALYLKDKQPQRPPLLIATAAIVLGRNPEPAAIAYVWLTVRVGIILFSLYLLSRQFGTSAFVPAAALVIFGSPLTCNFYRLYFMDEPFAAFGLLAFVLLLIDDQRQTVGSALAASAGILALFLIKPVAPAFVFPLCVIRGARAFLSFRRQRSNLTLLIRWAFPYALLLAIILVLLFATPYGTGIRDQYKLGLTGYWQKDVGFREAVKLICLILPRWLLLALFAVASFSRGLQHKPVILYVATGFLWWVLFSFRLTYTIEDRLLGQAMPYLVTGILLWLCQRSRVTFVITLAATFFFGYNVLAANGRTKHRGKTFARVQFLSPVPTHQQPVPEVGLIPFAKQMQAAVHTEKQEKIYGIFEDVYVTPNPLNMALRMTLQSQPLVVSSLPRTPQLFNLAEFCQARWFITKTRRPNDGSSGTGLWTTMNCLHWAVTENESPIHTYFQKVTEAPVHQPDLEDTLVLWHLPVSPPDSAIAECLRWLKPRLTNEPPAYRAAIDEELRRLSLPGEKSP